MDDNQQIVFIIALVSLAIVASSVLMLFFGFKAALMIVALVSIMITAYRYPRLGLWAFLIYLPFGATVTYSLGDVYQVYNYQVTYNNRYFLFHLAKDAFYIPALIALVILSQSFQKLRLTAKPLLWAIYTFLGACLLTMLLINGMQQIDAKVEGHPILMGIIGLKVLVGYIPLILCGYYLIRNQKDLWFLTRLQLLLILTCCSLCFLQYWFLVNGVCAGSSELLEPITTRASLQAHCFVGGSLLYNPEKQLIRLPGTFGAPWQWGWFLISSSFFAYGSYLSDPSRSWRLVSTIAIGMLIIASIISGQRIALVLVPTIFLVLMLLTEPNKKWLTFKLGIVVVLGIWSATHLEVVGERLNSLVDRWTYAADSSFQLVWGHPLRFVLAQFQWVIGTSNSLLGQGLGRTLSAARRLGDIQLIETFYAQLLYEIGWLGMIAFLSVVSVLTVLTFKAYNSLKTPSLHRLGFCLWIFVLLISYNTYYYPLLVDPVAVYYWFFAGVILKLPELEPDNDLLTAGDREEL